MKKGDIDYEKLYKDSIERAKELKGKWINEDGEEVAFMIFPELKGSDKIKAEIIDFIKTYGCTLVKARMDQWISWLEKQGEQNPYSGVSFKYNGHTFGMCARDGGVEILMDRKLKAFVSLDKSFIYSIRPLIYPIHPQSSREAIKEEKVDNANKVEPKFHEGDWIVFNGLRLFIKEVVQGYYRTISVDGIPNSYDWDIDNLARLWTIEDAKPGDVLANDHNILILKELDYDWSSNGTPNAVKAYCGIKPNGNFELGKDNWCFCGTLHIHPATEEQCILLFQKMKEAGYGWDEIKKELKEIEQNPSWSEEDEKIYNRIYDIVHSAAFSNCEVDEDGKERGEYAKMTKLLKSLKDRVQPKQEWSIADEEMLKDVKFNFEYNKEKMTDALIAQYNCFFDKIKSLKPQLQQEWSEEDEKRAERLLGWLDTLVNYIHDDAIVSLDLRRERIQQVVRLKTWLELLKDIYTWKPSDVQMRILSIYADQNNTHGAVLTSLYQDLKKLMEK